MDMVQFTSALGSDGAAQIPPQITIISGSTCVMFRPPYASYRSADDDPQKRLQWFNPANKIDFPPEQTHVFGLSQRFPGTIISLRFSLPAELTDSSSQTAKDEKTT